MIQDLANRDFAGTGNNLCSAQRGGPTEHVVNAIVERQPALLDQAQHGNRRDRLADAGQRKERAGRDRLVLGHVGPAIALGHD